MCPAPAPCYPIAGPVLYRAAAPCGRGGRHADELGPAHAWPSLPPRPRQPPATPGREHRCCPAAPRSAHARAGLPLLYPASPLTEAEGRAVALVGSGDRPVGRVCTWWKNTSFAPLWTACLDVPLACLQAGAPLAPLLQLREQGCSPALCDQALALCEGQLKLMWQAQRVVHIGDSFYLGSTALAYRTEVAVSGAQGRCSPGACFSVCCGGAGHDAALLYSAVQSSGTPVDLNLDPERSPGPSAGYCRLRLARTLAHLCCGSCYCLAASRSCLY